MWISIVISITLTAIVMLIAFALTRKWNRKKIKRKEESALRGVAAGISERLYAAYPDSKWRWECRPVGFATNGGIARIEVVYPSGKHQFVDVCLSESGYMALHTTNATRPIS